MATGKNLNIALAFTSGLPHYERLIKGISDYMRQHRLNWSFMIMPEAYTYSVQDLHEWPGDAIITNLNSFTEAKIATGFSIPVINISGFLEESPVPRVHVDNLKIGQLAAQHLMNRGFQHYAYYGLKNVAYSTLRLKGYRERLEEAGYPCKTLLVPAAYFLRGFSWHDIYKPIGEWLETLPQPVGLFAVTDYRARIVADACYNQKIEVPQQLAVIGVDNEETVCEYNMPTLSSIDRNDQEIGWNTAKLLDDLLNRRMIRNKEILIQPKDVIERRSTDTLAVTNAKLAAAIEFIHSNYNQPITVEWVAQHIRVSRRWLENAFRLDVRQTPYNYLCYYRIKQVKRLLIHEVKMRIEEIAHKTGFDNAKQLNTIFNRLENQSPTAFRQKAKEAKPANREE